jgi:16S rRNA (uracil1498-N3)-methyltransferase
MGKCLDGCFSNGLARIENQNEDCEFEVLPEVISVHRWLIRIFEAESLNLILLFKEDFTDGTTRVRLQGRRLRHVLEVHRAHVGDELCVGLAGSRIGTGWVTLLDRSVLEMEVRLDRTPPPPLPVLLMLALPRPKVLKRVLRSVTALGVKRIVLLNAFRVEKSYWSSPVLGPESLREQMIIGLEQSRDTMMPEVLLRPLFKPFVEDELPGLIKDTLPLVAHPAASAPCPRDAGRPVTLAVGPEGGFIPYEVEKLVAAGFSAVNCGGRVLSVETAVPALISRLLLY